MAIDRSDIEERRARIEQMIEQFRAAKQRRLVMRAMSLWRRAEARQQSAAADQRSKLVH